MLIPAVVGFKLTGVLPEGATATDLVLTVTQLLRKKGVVGKFVEFYGPGAAGLSLADRATIANMAPEYGATCGFFPVDDKTIEYLKLSGRAPAQIRLVEAYLKAQGLYWTKKSIDPDYTDTLELDIGTVEACLAGPKRPQDRVRLGDIPKTFQDNLSTLRKATQVANPGTPVAAEINRKKFELCDSAVVIASITSCTNTSNPSVMIAAGLLAQNAVKAGLESKPWVKTSLAPGSLVVTDYLKKAGLMRSMERLGFHVVGYGCATCIGNSGPLPEPVSEAIEKGSLVVSSVLSGNRNFEGRVHPEVRANFLASPPLVVAYALAGRVDMDLTKDPLGTGRNGKPVYLKDIWPTNTELARVMKKAVGKAMFQKRYKNVYTGTKEWRAIKVPKGDTYAWNSDSTYVQLPPYFQGMSKSTGTVTDITGARVLAVLGDSITTDHISPAGNIKKDSPAGRYLIEHGVKQEDFNSYGSRRGNHEVMMRGTFANVRIKNKMVPGVEGGMTAHLPDGEQMSIYDAAMKYKSENVPTIILAGKEYGSGSSRDWAAKGPMLQGIRAVIAESFERIHRSNLVGMGMIPLEFTDGQNIASLGLTGQEIFSIDGIASGIASQFKDGRILTVRASKADGSEITFKTKSRIDTPQEVEYYKHGGILQYVLRKLIS
jgi:aconitate hydratase